MTGEGGLVSNDELRAELAKSREAGRMTEALASILEAIWRLSIRGSPDARGLKREDREDARGRYYERAARRWTKVDKNPFSYFRSAARDSIRDQRRGVQRKDRLGAKIVKLAEDEGRNR